MITRSLFTKTTKEQEQQVGGIPGSALIAAGIIGMLAIIPTWPVWWIGDIYDDIRGQK